MDEEKAEALAKLLGGETWQSGGNVWLVLIRRTDGKIVAISDEVVCEYANEEALAEGRVGASIYLT
jgi:hypothetical protein